MEEYLLTLGQIATADKQAETLDLFLSFLETELTPLYAGGSKNTRDQASWAIAILITHLGEIRTSELKLRHINLAFARIRIAYPEPGTQKIIRKYLSRALRLAVRYQLIPWNFAEEIKTGKSSKRKNVPAPAQFATLWRFHRDNALWGPKFFLQGVLGLRDEEANSITADMLTSDSLFVPGTKNVNAERTIHLPPKTAEILAVYASGGRSLVRNVFGRQLKETQNRDLQLAYKRAKVPYAANHGLRHFFGQIEAAIGCPRSIRMAILGQETSNNIGDLYVHPTPENIRDWLRKWEVFLGLDDPECLPAVLGHSGARRKLKDKEPV